MGDFATIAKHLWDGTVRDAIYENVAILAWFQEGEKNTVSGQDMKKVRYVDDMQDLVQPYNDDTIVEAQGADDKAVATFQWKAARLAVWVTERQMLLTKNMMEVSVDFVADKLKRSVISFKRYLNRRLLGLSGTTTDGSEDFQGLRDALTHDLTYGGTTRATTGTNPEWQGGSLAGTYADQATTYPCSIATVRDMMDVCNEFEPDPGDLALFVGRGPFRELQGQVEGQTTYNPVGKMLKYGFPSFSIEGVEVVMDYHLAEKYATGASRWAYMLNRASWEFRLHPERNFSVDPFTMQDRQAGGKAGAMALIKIMGNCTCDNPAGNIWVPKFGS